MKIFNITALIACVLSSGMLFASDFEAANKLYESGKYTEAVAAYEAMVKEGNSSAEVLFNLGNAYFKDKKIGNAILNYERAHKMAPRDADIKYNLDFARSFIKENAVEDSASRFLSGAYYFLTINELSLVFSAVFILLIALLFLRLAKKNELTYWLTFSVSILFLAVLVLGSARIIEAENVKSAIIISASVEAKSAPLDSNPASFTIPEGKKVLILNLRGDWAEVLLKSENIKGWIKKDALSEI